MDKHITNIKDLVIKFMANGKEIEAKAKEGDAASCFQMGMVHLLGIKASVDFKKAGQFFSNQSLANDADAKRLLGLIAEYEGNYSLAFENYASATGGDFKQSYIENVIRERGNLQDFLRKMSLPTELNKEISAILVDYIKGGKSKVDAIFKIATICDDQPSTIIVAQYLCDVGQYNLAKRWLQNGNVPNSNPLYATIKKKEEKWEKELYQKDILEIIEIEGFSILKDFVFIPSSVNIKNKCDEVGASCKHEFSNIALKIIDIIKKQKEAEEARIRKQKAEEEARRRREEEEEALRKKEEEKKALKKKKEDEERLEKKKKAKRLADKLCIGAYLGLLVFFFVYFLSQGREIKVTIFSVFAVFLITILPFLLIWFITRSEIESRYRDKTKDKK